MIPYAEIELTNAETGAKEKFSLKGLAIVNALEDGTTELHWERSRRIVVVTESKQYVWDLVSKLSQARETHVQQVPPIPRGR